MMRVLVSGGTGAVGRYIVEHLLETGYKVTLGGRRPPAPGLFSREVGFRPLHLDPDVDQIDAFFDSYYFVHCAFSHVPGKYRGGEGDDPDGFRRRNLDGSVRLFEAARDAGVRRCVFLSSRAAYGSQPPGAVLTEENVPRPDTLYGSVKLDTERSLQALCDHSFVTASLRVTGVYGAPEEGSGHKWHGLIADYLAGRPIEPRAGTEVHGSDVGNAVRLMLETDALRINGEVFNVSDRMIDRRDILALAQDMTRCPHPLPEAADVSGCNPMSTFKLSALGWQPGGRSLFEATVRELARPL